jgi:hypothetical protein
VKGKKQVGKLTSAERGRNITVIFSMNVTGHFIPPMFIFPRKKMDKNGRLRIAAPPDSIGVACDSGWMNAKTFRHWPQHFQQHVHSSAARTVLLIMDGHSSHKDLKVIEYARDNHIHMLSTPPHTTHKLQPHDRIFFKPFNSSKHTDQQAHRGCVKILMFTKVARLEIAQNGFRCTGIQPFHREIFSDLDFLGSALTDIPLIENQEEQSTTQVCSHAAATENEPEPSTSTSALASSKLQRKTSRSSVNTEEVSNVLKTLSPLPDASKMRLSVRNRRTLKSEILTSSPFKNELKEKIKNSRKLSKTTKKC